MTSDIRTSHSKFFCNAHKPQKIGVFGKGHSDSTSYDSRHKKLEPDTKMFYNVHTMQTTGAFGKGHIDPTSYYFRH